MDQEQDRKEWEARQLQDLLNSPGWEMLNRYLQDRIQGYLSRLKAESFADLAEVARIQGKIEAYESIYGEIKDKIRRGIPP